MKTSKIILSALFFCILSVGMSYADDVTKEQLSGKWMLKSIKGNTVGELFTDRTPYIIFNFDIDQVSGSMGCSSFSGKINYGGDDFKTYNIESTEMTCPDGTDERRIIDLLSQDSKISLSNGELVFKQKDETIMVFRRADPLTASDLQGMWRLTSIDGNSATSEFRDQIPNLVFDFANGKVSGFAGCNNYNGNFTLSKNVLTVTPLVTTRMACDYSDQENKFTELFSGNVDINMENNKLTFRKNNKVVMTFEK